MTIHYSIVRMFSMVCNFSVWYGVPNWLNDPDSLVPTYWMHWGSLVLTSWMHPTNKITPIVSLINQSGASGMWEIRRCPGSDECRRAGPGRLLPLSVYGMVRLTLTLKPLERLWWLPSFYRKQVQKVKVLPQSSQQIISVYSSLLSQFNRFRHPPRRNDEFFPFLE